MDLWKPLLPRMSKSSAVCDLQERLGRLGFDPGAHDGVYGPLTREAVSRCQAAYRLAVDGVVGPEVRGFLRMSIPPCRVTVRADEGDTLHTIARAYETTAEALIEANRRKRFEDVYPGEPLVIHCRVAGVFADVDAWPVAEHDISWTFAVGPGYRITGAGTVEPDIPASEETAGGPTTLAMEAAATGDAAAEGAAAAAGDVPGVPIRGLFARVRDSSDGCEGTRVLVRSRSAAARACETVTEHAARTGCAGIVLDIGGIDDEECGGFLRLVGMAARKCRAARLKLGVVVPGITQSTCRSSGAIGYDLETIGRHVDFVLVDQRDPFTLWDSIIWTCNMVPRWKVISLIELRPFRMDVDTAGEGNLARCGASAMRPLDAEEMRALIKQHVIRPGRDEESKIPFITYRARGVQRRVWQEDVESLGKKLHWVNRLNILGVSFRGVSQARPGILAELSRRFIIM